MALANKESLVVGGELVTALAEATDARILPGRLRALGALPADRRRAARHRGPLVLTASGGPFRGRDDLSGVTREEALAHPTWDMGGKITIDSATLMNKGLELIEAHHLFGVPYDRDRRRRPPAVDRPLAGPPQRRRHARPPRLPRHEGADLLRAAPTRSAPTCDVPHARPRRGRASSPSSRPTPRPSPACGSRARPARWAGPRRACSTPPTRSRSHAFLDGPPPVHRDRRGDRAAASRSVPAGPVGHFEDLFAADERAREHARGLIEQRSKLSSLGRDELAYVLAFAGLRGADHPARVRALHRRQGDRDAGRALLPLLPAQAGQRQTRGDRVRDRRDPARRLRQDHRHEPGRGPGAGAGRGAGGRGA